MPRRSGWGGAALRGRGPEGGSNHGALKSRGFAGATVLGLGTVCGKVPGSDLLLLLFPAAQRSRWPRRSHCPRASLGRRWSLPSTTRTSQVEGMCTAGGAGGHIGWGFGWNGGVMEAWLGGRDRMEDLRTWAVTARPGLRRPTPVPSSLGSSSLGFTSSPSPFSSSSPENVEDSGLDSPSLAAPGPSPESWVPRPGTPQSPPTCRAQHQEARDPVPRVPSPGPWGPEAGAGAGKLEPSRCPRAGVPRQAGCRWWPSYVGSPDN